MANIYYDKWEFEKALDCMNTNPQEARLKFEKYLEKYPEDFSAYTYYSTTLCLLGEFDETEKTLDFIEENFKNFKIFSTDKAKSKLLLKSILYNKIKLLCYKGEYQEIHSLFHKHFDLLNTDDLKPTIFYTKKQLGLLDLNRREPNAYMYRQIVRYEESDFLEHIKKHLDKYNIDVEEPNKSIFSPNFPFEDVLKEVKKYIPSEKRIYPGYFENIYVFKYDECGRDNKKITNYFKVICFDKTADIITMCPSNDCENLPYIDLNYMVKDNEQPKVKRLSRIERFEIRLNKAKTN